MPSLKTLRHATRALEVPIGDDPEAVVKLRYRPAAYTPELEDLLFTEDPEQVKRRPILQALCRLVTEWDLTTGDEDAEGKAIEDAPIAITPEGLLRVPSLFLLDVLLALGADQRPLTRKADPASDSS